MTKNIRVQNSGFVHLQFFDDKTDGNLIIGESQRSVPFAIKRIYYITNFNNRKAVRGKHAHKKLKQIIFCVHGSFDLHLDDGEKKQKITMNDPYVGVKLYGLIWHTMKNFSHDCVILVLADDYYDKNDYIRDYAAFKTAAKKKIVRRSAAA